MKWMRQTQYATVVRKNGRTLALLAAGVPGHKNIYIAAAIETEAVSESLAAVFDSHGHQIIGEDFKTLKAAQAACRAYAKKWVAKQVLVKPCTCTELDIKTPKRRMKLLGSSGFAKRMETV